MDRDLLVCMMWVWAGFMLILAGMGSLMSALILVGVVAAVATLAGAVWVTTIGALPLSVYRAMMPRTCARIEREVRVERKQRIDDRNWKWIMGPDPFEKLPAEVINGTSLADDFNLDKQLGWADPDPIRPMTQDEIESKRRTKLEEEIVAAMRTPGPMILMPDAEMHRQEIASGRRHPETDCFLCSDEGMAYP